MMRTRITCHLHRFLNQPVLWDCLYGAELLGKYKNLMLAILNVCTRKANGLSISENSGKSVEILACWAERDFASIKTND